MRAWDKKSKRVAATYVVCNPLDDPFRIRLREYQLSGTRAAPDEEDQMVSVYETRILTGQLKIELEYFADEACQEKQLYAVFIDNE